jgi:mevalonate kinase
LGAKLSGGGMGGNMIALIVPEKADEVKVALEKAGAHQVLAVEVGR